MSEAAGVPVPDRTPALVCDLDGTLIRVNTFPLFAPFLLRELVRRGRLRDAAKLSAAALLRRAGWLSHPGFKAQVATSANTLPRTSIHHWADQVVAEHLNYEVAETVRSWEGVRILSTAAPEIYAREIGGLMGFEHVQGSLIMTGGFHDNAGVAKVSRLRQIVQLPVDIVITDDEAADAPLIAAARSAQIVARAK